jgi:hypothetical protein
MSTTLAFIFKAATWIGAHPALVTAAKQILELAVAHEAKKQAAK